MSKTSPFLMLVIILASCQSDDDQMPISPEGCNTIAFAGERNFNMGFSSWPYDATIAAIDSTYSFIAQNADLISEQEDDEIPWSAWMNGTPLPADFVNGVNYRASLRPAGHAVLLSVSLLNINRDDLIADLNGQVPSYTAMNDQAIEDAYFLHVSYLVDAFEPDYLVLAMECNQLYYRAPQKWDGYKALMANIRARISAAYPGIPLSESFTLHDWVIPEPGSPADFIQEITDYGANFDFAAISFYPFLENFHTEEEFDFAFDFLYDHISKPIAFVETGQPSEDVIAPGLSVNIIIERCEQEQYLAYLLSEARTKNFLFINWWCFADYDALLALFPPETVDLGKLWINTGLINGDGASKPALSKWREALGE